jgi:hypothetical protein
LGKLSLQLASEERRNFKFKRIYKNNDHPRRIEKWFPRVTKVKGFSNPEFEDYHQLESDAMQSDRVLQMFRSIMLL